MVILICGNIADGKDTVARIMMESLPHAYIGRFAELPKKQSAQILGIDWEEFNSHSSPNKKKYREYYKNHAEALKQVYGHDVWAKALKNQYLKRGGFMIVPDTRFPHEANAFQDTDCLVVRVKRIAPMKVWSEAYPNIEILSKYGVLSEDFYIEDARKILEGVLRLGYENKDHDAIMGLKQIMLAPSETSINDIGFDRLVINASMKELREYVYDIVSDFI